MVKHAFLLDTRGSMKLDRRIIESEHITYMCHVTYQVQTSKLIKNKMQNQIQELIIK